MRARRAGRRPCGPRDRHQRRAKPGDAGRARHLDGDDREPRSERGVEPARRSKRCSSATCRFVSMRLPRRAARSRLPAIRTACRARSGPIAGNASTSVTLTGRGSFAGDVFAEATVAVAPGGALDDVPEQRSREASLSIAQRIAATPAQSIALTGATRGRGRRLRRRRLRRSRRRDGLGAGPRACSMNIADPANPSRRMFADAAVGARRRSARQRRRGRGSRSRRRSRHRDRGAAAARRTARS